MKDLQTEKNRLQHKVTLLLEENKVLKKLAQTPLARKNTKKELAMGNKKKR